jgi:biopolymer transport protein ExbD
MKLERTMRCHPGFLFLAPVFDVAFLLVCFVALSTSFLLQPGVAVQVPRSPFLLAPQKSPAVLSITGPPRTAYFFGNREVSLEELRTQWEQQPLPGTLVIKADAFVPYEMVLEAAALALEFRVPVVLATEEPR